MFCMNCGAENADNDKFCKSCGKLLVSENFSAETNDTGEVASSVATPAGASGVKQWLSVRRNKFILAVVALIVIAGVVGVNVSNYLSNQVSAGVLEQAMKDDYKNGFVGPMFVNDSEYKFTDIRVNSKEKIEKSSSAYSDLSSAVKQEVKSIEADLYHVEWYGKASNDSFESEYTAECYFVKEESGFQKIVDVNKTWSTTKPKKGIDYFYLNNGKVEHRPGWCISNSSENFECDFDESQKTCTAKQKYSVEYWWGGDTVDLTQKFVFDEDSGWKTDGDVKTENLITSYDKLEGMTFATNYILPTGSFLTTATQTGSIKLKKCSEDSLIAEYTLAYHPKGEQGNKIDLNGEATGTLKHELKYTGFDFEMKASDGSVTLKGTSGGESNGKQSIRVTMNSKSSKWQGAISDDSDYWAFKDQSFIENS